MPESSNQLNEQIARLNKDTIPQGVAISKDIIDFENKSIVFSFKDYKQTQCEIVKLQKQEVKKLTKILAKISNTPQKDLLNETKSGLDCKPAEKNGNYSVFYEGLSEDVEIIYEIDYKDTGRIFGYLVGNK